jgi:hypothetical protein
MLDSQMGFVLRNLAQMATKFRKEAGLPVRLFSFVLGQALWVKTYALQSPRSCGMRVGSAQMVPDEATPADIASSAMGILEMARCLRAWWVRA